MRVSCERTKRTLGCGSMKSASSLVSTVDLMNSSFRPKKFQKGPVPEGKRMQWEDGFNQRSRKTPKIEKKLEGYKRHRSDLMGIKKVENSVENTSCVLEHLSLSKQ